MKNNKGFALLEGLLILVVVGILGFTGWYVWSAKNKTNSTYNSTGNSSAAKYTKKSTPVTPDPTADWTSYSSKEGQFSLKYPKTWVTASLPDLCSPGSFLLGADTKSVGHCGADGPSAFGQISITSTDGDNRSSDTFKSGYKDTSTSTVTVDGVVGQRQAGTASGQESDPEHFAYPLPDGAKLVVYQFFTKAKTYNLDYQSQTRAGIYPDVLSDFELMVTKTLKFSAS